MCDIIEGTTDSGANGRQYLFNNYETQKTLLEWGSNVTGYGLFSLTRRAETSYWVYTRFSQAGSVA